jgi:hypothetical protein
VDCVRTGVAVVNDPATQARVKEPLCNLQPLCTVYVHELPLDSRDPGDPQPPLVPAGAAGIVHEFGVQLGCVPDHAPFVHVCSPPEVRL